MNVTKRVPASINSPNVGHSVYFIEEEEGEYEILDSPTDS